MFTLSLLVLFTFAISGCAVVDFCKTRFESMIDHAESSIKCSAIDYEICKNFKSC